MTRSELYSVMTVGMATVAGSVLVGYALLGVPLNFLLAATFMTAPSGLLMAKMVVPETEDATLTDSPLPPTGRPSRTVPLNPTARPNPSPGRSPTRRRRVPRWGRLPQPQEAVRRAIHSPASRAATPAPGRATLATEPRAGTRSRCGGTGRPGSWSGTIRWTTSRRWRRVRRGTIRSTSSTRWPVAPRRGCGWRPPLGPC